MRTSGGNINAIWEVLFAIAGVAVGLPLALYASRKFRRSKGAAFASALFFSFGLIRPQQRDLMEEAQDQTKRKKDDRSGDPPTPGIAVDE